MKIVIVGGVAVGATTATRLRRLSEENEIVIFEKGPYISFANCGLPYHIGGIIENREDLLLQTPQKMHGRFNLDIRVKSEVIAINREEKTVTIRRVDNDYTYTESYDKLILAPGARPIVPPIPGLQQATNLFTLRDVPDTDTPMDIARRYRTPLVFCNHMRHAPLHIGNSRIVDKEGHVLAQAGPNSDEVICAEVELAEH